MVDKYLYVDIYSIGIEYSGCIRCVKRNAPQASHLLTFVKGYAKNRLMKKGKNKIKAK